MAESPIMPRNLTARATYRVPGNPATSRPDDAVANCFPGLELDVRNLDRRFFPGLVFDFVARDDIYADYDQPHRYGARLAFVDVTNDPDLTGADPTAAALMSDLQGKHGSQLATGEWYIESIEQDGHRISMTFLNDSDEDQPLDGLYVWRIVRGLRPPAPRPDPTQPPAPFVRLVLRCRTPGREAESVTLTGWRRRFTDSTSGVISLAYQPGELLQSLCSPWQHDFRDCGCHYWAANHPDVVVGEVLPGAPMLPDGAAADPALADTPIDWLRADRRPGMAAEMGSNVTINRPFQYDHYEINHAWQDLAVVVHGAEIDQFYVPRADVPAEPYADLAEMATAIRDQLAPVELTLALEYLYARASVVDPEDLPSDAPGTLYDDAVFARHFLLLTAVSEMQHVRWSNQILWTIGQLGPTPRPPFVPVLGPSPTVPAPHRRTGPLGASHDEMPDRPAELRPLTLDVLDDFVGIEHPSAVLDESWSRVVATLRLGDYPAHLVELAERITRDGNDHYSRFCEIRSVLRSTYGHAQPSPWLRPIRLASSTEAADALASYHLIIARLRAAYDDQAQGDYARSSPPIVEARTAMDSLLKEMERLGGAGLGVPFW